MIRKISGKHCAQKINHLHVNGTEVTDVSDIVNTLGETFSDNSSSDHCSTFFKSYKQNAEKYSISFTSNNTETYNNPFSMDELTNAISKSHDTAVGPDSIHYQMLKNLPDSTTDTLLGAINYIWTTGNFPPEWHLATVIPIAKPSKDSTDPTSYRPITLTSCLCKVMESMINTRLVWYLEKLKLITPVQSGFRKQCSTTDQLVRLETFVREAFVNKQHAVAIFSDVEKAYDITSKYGIMKDLFNAGLRGRLPIYI